MCIKRRLLRLRLLPSIMPLQYNMHWGDETKGENKNFTYSCECCLMIADGRNGENRERFFEPSEWRSMWYGDASHTATLRLRPRYEGRAQTVGKAPRWSILRSCTRNLCWAGRMCFRASGSVTAVLAAWDSSADLARRAVERGAYSTTVIELLCRYLSTW